MQGETVVVEPALVALAVAGVVDDRVADGRHVHPDLVGPPGLEGEPDHDAWRGPRGAQSSS